MTLYIILSLLLTVSIILLTSLGYLWGALLCALAVGLITVRLYLAVLKSRRNILTVLRAVEHNDYSFQLSTSRRTSGDSEVNRTLNRIKEIIRDAREEVRQHEAFLGVIIEQVPTGIIITTPQGHVRLINRSALRLLSLPVLTHLRRLDSLYPELYHTLTAQPGEGSKAVTIHTEKAIHHLSVESTSVVLQAESVRIVILHDIENELDRRETDSWIALIRVMTHEIMNSIAPIRSVSEVLLSSMRNATAPDEVTIGAVETIYNTSDTLIRFVEDYRKFSAVPQPQPVPFDLTKLLEQAVRLHEPELQRKAISVDIVTDGAPEVLTADPTLVMQVLHNLIKNAVEATPPDGQMTLTAYTADNGRTAISLFNSGELIPDDVKDYIFIPFFTTKAGGSGIGLSLSRYIMRLHGGNLRYRPVRGGVTFLMDF